MRTENLLNVIKVVKTVCGDDWYNYNTSQNKTETVDDLVMLSPSIQVSFEDGEIPVYGSYIIAQIPSREEAIPISRAIEEAEPSEDDFSYGVMVMENTSPFKHENFVAIINVGSFHREDV